MTVDFGVYLMYYNIGIYYAFLCSLVRKPIFLHAIPTFDCEVRL